MSIVNLVGKVTNSLDKMKSVIGVLIDLRKAFFTIDHTNVLQMLNHIGSNMHKLKELSPHWKVFYVVFPNNQFSAPNCFI